MSLFKNTNHLSLALGVSLCGLGGYLIYQYLKSDNEISLQLIVPSAYVGHLIGRRGHRLKALQDQSGAKIDFHERSKGPTTESYCVIRGTQDSVCQAEFAIKDIIEEQKATLCEHISIPEKFVSRLIGQEGSTIGAICDLTGARINVEKTSGTEVRQIALKGTREQIDFTKQCVQELMNDHMQMIESLEKRTPRAHCKYAEKLGGVESSTTPFEVYVSAMVDPSRFWLQIVGPKAQQLDQLVEEMTDYYKVPDNRDWHKLKNVEVGDLVAATFFYDERWYRAEVLEINDNLAELYYVDYGDTEKVALADLYELKVNFLKLHFQAIECFLARIEPVEETWTSEAVDRFEEWAHVAQWRKLSAKVADYSFRERTRAQRSDSPVPGVELFDVVNDADINIGEELVRQGYAVHSRAGESSRSLTSSDLERS